MERGLTQDLYQNSQYEIIELIQQNQMDYALERISALPEEYYVQMFSDWAQDNRYIPEGISDFPGPFDKEFAPHWNEVLDRLHPDDPVRIISVIKSVQSMFTTTVCENGMGAFIRNKLGSILYLTSTKTIASVRGSANIDTLIDNSNLAEYIRPMSNRNKRKTKDNVLYKELAGNSIFMMSSYNSVADLKSNKFNFIVEDELDEAAAEIKDLGDVEKVVEGRTYGTAFYKILQGSTSSRAETSRIYKNYLLGDRRHFFPPCPHCGEKQELDLKREGEDFGLTFRRDTDKKTGIKILKKESIRFICKYCKKDFHESDKHWLLNNGVWRPTSQTTDPLRTSYKAPGLLSPVLPWARICQAFIDTGFGQDIPKYKDFVIDMMASPWFSVKKSAKWEMLKERAEEYTLGIVPQGKLKTISGVEVYTGPMLFYGGVDVQGDRLELAVVGFGYNGEKWIVDRQVFYGNTARIDDPCYTALSDFAYQKTYLVSGQEVYIGGIAMDAGYDPRKAAKRKKDFNGKAHIVYEFVSLRQDKFIAIMGNPDEKSMGIIKESRINDVKTTLTKRYMVSVSLLKESIYAIIENSEGFNTIHVPKYVILEGVKVEIEDEFYKQILSERYQDDPKKPGKMGWFPIRARNEMLDVLNYSIARAYFDNIFAWSIEEYSSYYKDLTGNYEEDYEDYGAEYN